MPSLKASQKGHEHIKRARKEKFWVIEDHRWLVAASQILEPSIDWASQPYVEKQVVASGVSLSTWKRFLQGKPINPDVFKAFCQILDLDWHAIAEPFSSDNDSEDSAVPVVHASSKIFTQAPDVSTFFGRLSELDCLERWIVQDGCRFIAILGLGGIGKTTLSVKLVELVQHQFDYVVWRSLQDAPSLQEFLTDLLLILSEQQVASKSERIEVYLSQLMNYLHEHRCLLIVDNVESLFQGNQRAGCYREGYEAYGQLFRRIADAQHQSCIVLTSREKPSEFAIREDPTGAVRSLQLKGLSPIDGHCILEMKGLVKAEDQWNNLVNYYAGNPLAIKIAAATIQSLFNGDVVAFLNEKTTAFGDVWQLLDEQFHRLSEPEKQIMFWLAINREWTTWSAIRDDVLPLISQRHLLEAVESLQGRSLIETSSLGFTQQSVVMEYVTEQLINAFYQDITEQKLQTLRSHSFIKAQTSDHIRDAQIRLILQPLIQRLLSDFGNPKTIEQSLKILLKSLHHQSFSKTGYAGGNLLNLLWQLGIDIKGYDFSHMAIAQAYLPHTTLYGTNFANAQISKSVFTETFGGIASIAFSPDGTLLAVGDTDGEIRVWSVTRGQQVLSFKAHIVWIWSIAFSPNGRYFASAGDDYLIRLWEASTGNCVGTFAGHTSTVITITFHPNGRTLASCSRDATIKFWDVSHLEGSQSHQNIALSQPTRTLHAHDSCVWSIAFSSDGEMLASSSEDQTIKLWNIATGECHRTFAGHSNWVKSIAFNRESTLIASGSFDQTINIWSIATGQCLQTLKGHTDTVTQIAFSVDDQWIASSSYDRTIKLWDVVTGQCQKTLFGHDSRVLSLAFSPNGYHLASGGDDHAVKQWNLQTGQCFKTWKGHTNPTLDMALSPDQQWLATGHQDQRVRLWNPQTGQILKTLVGHTNRVWSVAFAPRLAHHAEEELVLASGSGDYTIKIWNGKTGQCLQTLHGHTSWVWCVVFSPLSLSSQDEPSEGLLASSSYDATVRLWDVKTGTCIGFLEGHTASVVSIAFSPDGQWLAGGSFDAMIRLWDVNTRQCVQTFEGHQSTIWKVAFSPDGQQLASCSYDQTIRVWDVQTGRCIHTFKGHTAPVSAICFSLDGRSLFSGSFDNTMKQWDVETGVCQQTLTGHRAIVSCLRVGLYDGSTVLFSSSFDETVRRWQGDRADQVSILRVPRPYEGMNITGVTGLTKAEKETLKALGAVEDGDSH